MVILCIFFVYGIIIRISDLKCADNNEWKHCVVGEGERA